MQEMQEKLEYYMRQWQLSAAEPLAEGRATSSVYKVMLDMG